MKKKMALLLVVLIYIFSPIASNAQNLIRNSDFKEITQQGVANWKKDGTNPEYYTVIAQDNVLCMDNNITNFSKLQQSIKVTPNKYYKISAKIKVQKSSGLGAYIMVPILADSIRSTSKVVDVNDDWQDVTMYGKTDDSQYAINLNLCFGGEENETQGRAYFKDITLEELNHKPEDYENWYVSNINSGEKKIIVELVSKLTLTAFAIFVVWCMVKNIANNSLGQATNKKTTKRDIIIMTLLSLAYLGLALYNLGDRISPQTGWYPTKKGEYAIIKLPKMTHIEKITCYQGLNSKECHRGKIKLQYLDGDMANGDVERYHILGKLAFDNYKWIELNEDTNASLIKLEMLEEGIELKEIAVYEKGSYIPLNLEVVEDKTQNHVANNLIDEQKCVKYQGDYKNQSIFDEICYPRTGYEYLNNMEGFEYTHPPLGKIFLALGIKIFGMTPFGWRIVGTLFGAAMIPAMYLFAKKLFEKTIYGILGAVLIMFDCMHFTQTRTSLIDSYSTLFIILMYYYMTDIYTSTEQKVTKKYVKSLVLSGVFFSLGVATKWIAVYGGAGLCIIYFVSLYKNLRQSKKDIIKSMSVATLAFVVLPIVTYLAVYIPVLKPTQAGYTLMGVWSHVEKMFLFHKEEVFAHMFASNWYEWFLMIIPMNFYNKIYEDGLISKIVTVGNPAIWWISLASVVFSTIMAYRKKDNKAWIFVIGYMLQYLPWMFIKRTTFIYHYFSTIPFAILAIIYVLSNLEDNTKKEIYMYMATVITTFIVFYPKLSGLPVHENYDAVIKIMCIIVVFWMAKYLNRVLKKLL